VEHQGEGGAPGVTTARFVIGVDLGTTNCAVAYADLEELTAAEAPRVRVFDVPQVVAEGEVAHRETLPSFLYLLPDQERGNRGYALPWQPTPVEVIGTWARDQGALVPGRLVSSAKSWLCNDAVDRRARILPWAGDGDAARSPVEASASYLAHVRDAWNHAMAGGAAGAPRRFERQAIVLTVPASFDEEARELTVEAAGLEHVTLIEEPTAALYAWIAAHRGRLSDLLRDGDRLLICDVGGGTTDFTLVLVHFDADGEPHFERSAVGHHLLLGGDNLDLALVRHVEEKLGRPKLTLRQQQALRRQCATAKEQLLGPPPTESVTVSVLGAGTSVVGGALSTRVSREEVLSLLLDGFLPSCPPDATPATERRSGLRELGLPFASDPAITRHLAAFLREAGDGGPARPDVVLFNGGFFTPAEARTRVADVLAGWFAQPGSTWSPRVLTSASPATAVAEGAACFGLARRGHGLRIGGGSPRTYYVALADEPTTAGRVRAVCVLPRGAEDGTNWRLDQRTFTVAANRPLSFTLLSSLTRRDAVGDVVDVEPAAVHRHAPLVTELRFGRRSVQAEVRVALEVRATEVGTLELWLLAPETGHRWRLQFQLRAAGRDAGEEDTASSGAVQPEALEAAAGLVRAAFAAGAGATAAPPDSLMAHLESVMGFGKHAWPLAMVRPLADVLLEQAEGRRLSARHEARWLNLLGYCLRPGFGATLDEWRMTQARRLYLAGLAFPSDVQCHAEWLVLWQRVAGGLTPGQQQEIYQRHAALVGVGSSSRRSQRLPPQVEREALRLLASLEHVSPQKRVSLGEDLLARLRRDRRSATLLWAIARVGERVPFHGPLNTVVPPGVARAWIDALLDLVPMSDDLVAAVVQVAARTGDGARDLDEDFCRAVHARLVGAGVPEIAVRRLVEIHNPSASETVRAYGESLPEGLRLVR
jgi:molecular chaperone DnaK (HSP70)